MAKSTFQTLTWLEEKRSLRLLDQRRLPTEELFFECRELRQVAEAIKTLAVRGAPAIGVAAAYGVVIGVQEATAVENAISTQKFSEIIDELAATRPTAVNLFWALARMKKVGKEGLRREFDGTKLRDLLLVEAHRIYAEDDQAHRRLGEHGSKMIPTGARILTHCNAGALACAEYGTALGVIRAAQAAGKDVKVYADETRPLLQGSRLTTWELLKEKIPVTLICDNMAAHCMAKGMIDLVIVGADRIAANGDTANKIGTYSVALAAKAHNLPFYVAAPTSTIDFSLAEGSAIPIEERDPDEVRFFGEKQTAPAEVAVYNPAFDVTPAALISAIITEKGVFTPTELSAAR
ncbi:MAG: S-methyl-5-thioribose-1-phosphate isomerase [Pseudomonadota bacterium]|nr:S-methyl-5-thioribose-1-phosphate isomerase [Pseudomonadota bacterium]